MSDSASKFQIRNQIHEIEGSFTESEIIEQILSGHYTGDEEVASYPYTEWQKLSSHPTFYDAFLKRLYPERYPIAPSLKKPKQKSKPKTEQHEKATRQLKSLVSGSRADKDSHADGKTNQIDKADDFGATVHQSEIDKLFNSTAEKDDAPAQIASAHKTGEFVIPQELDPLPDVPELLPNKDSSVKANTGGSRRRVWSLTALVATLLFLLYVMGKGGSSHPTPLSQTAEKTSFADAKDINEVVNALLDEAQSLYLDDTPVFYSGAKELFQKAYEADPKSVEALSGWALSAAHLISDAKDPEPLIKEMNRAIQLGRSLAPQKGAFYRAEAMAALAKKDLDKAKKLIGDAKEADPTNKENDLMDAEITYAQGDLDDARALLEEAVSNLPSSARAHYYLSRVNFQLSDWANARAEAFSATRWDPLHANTYALLGDMFSQKNDLKDAKLYYELSARLAPFADRAVASHAFYRLGVLSDVMGDTATAKNSFILAAYYGGEATTPDLKNKLKGITPSPEEVKKRLSDTLYDQNYFLEHGQDLMKNNDPAGALRFFQALYIRFPQNGEALVRAGDAMEKLASSYEDFRRIMIFYQRAIDQHPNLPQAYVKLGMLETEQYDFDKAYKLLAKAYELAPDDPDVNIALVEHFFKRENYKSAQEFLDRAKNENPNDSRVYYYFGKLRLLYRVSSDQEEIDKSHQEQMEDFHKAYELNPENYDALSEWMKLKVDNYDKNFAIKFMRALLLAEPTNAKLYWVMGEIYAANKEYLRAIEYYHKSLDYDNLASKTRLSLARSLAAVGKIQEAVAEFQTASRLDKRNGTGLYEAANLLYEMKNYPQAQALLKELLNTLPHYPGAHQYLAKVYAAQGDKEDAIQEMSQEVADNPLNYDFTISYAELLMSYEKWDKAIEQLTKVTTLPPVTEEPQFHHQKIRAFLLLSRCYRMLDRAEEAEGAIKMALSIDSDDPELHKELGSVYHAEQREREAVKEFQFYLDRNPAAQDAGMIKDLINHMVIQE